MNYIGSKLSLLDFITSTVEDFTQKPVEEGGTFADLFAGTGVVGAAFREKGWSVISNDIQAYSYVLNKHKIENSDGMRTSFADAFESLNGIEGFVFKNYCSGSGSGRNYFSDDNGKKCDTIRTEIERLHNEGCISSDEYYWYLASLIESIDKYANTASVYGAFLKHIKRTAAASFEFKLLPINNGKLRGRVYNDDINELVKQKTVCGDVLYLDPPYNQRQYCTNYHVLETIALNDSPTLKGKTGLREYSHQKSLYCSTKTASKAFDDLIHNADFEYILLSYNNEGIMPLDVIREIMSQYGHYEVYTKDYHRFRADKEENRNHKGDTTVEYLHCLKKS